MKFYHPTFQQLFLVLSATFTLILPTQLVLADSQPAMIFKKPSAEELRNRLTPLQYQVTQESDTERPFDNAYWNEKRDGIYVDITSGEPLFSSKDKFDSGTGWPSFIRPINKNAVVEKKDISFYGIRVEIRSRFADSHLGHVFDDGPEPTGKRYCMNSAALLFIPKNELVNKGYAQYVSIFEK